jgi:hypothetical protein
MLPQPRKLKTQPLGWVCRNEGFQMQWLRAQVMANGIKKEIQGTRFSFKDVTAPKNRAPSRQLQTLIGESSTTNSWESLPDYNLLSNFRDANTLSKQWSRHLVCSDGCSFQSETIGRKYCLGLFVLFLHSAIVEARVADILNFLSHNPVSHQIKKAAMLVKTLYTNVLYTVYKASSILATIPATSCSAKNLSSVGYEGRRCTIMPQSFIVQERFRYS